MIAIHIGQLNQLVAKFVCIYITFILHKVRPVLYMYMVPAILGMSVVFGVATWMLPSSPKICFLAVGAVCG